MTIVMQREASAGEVARVVGIIRSHGLTEHISQGNERTVIGAVGNEQVFRSNELGNLPGVERVIHIFNDQQAIGHEVQSEDSVVHVRGVTFGGNRILDITVDEQSAGHTDAVYADPSYLPAHAYAGWGTDKGRAQETDMRDSLQRLHETGKSVLVRIQDVRQAKTALAMEADILYLGGKLMDDRALQDEVDRLNTPVVLCRDRHHRADDWSVATEHIAQRSNRHVILGEAGTLSFEPEHTRRLDVDAIVRVRRASHLPIIISITRLWYNDIPQNVLYRLAVTTGANGAINSLE